MSVLFGTVLILVIPFLRGCPFFLKFFEVHTLLVVYGLCLFRRVFVLEMPFTFPVGLQGGFSPAYAKVREIQIPVGNFQIGILDLLGCIWLAAAATLFARFVWREHDVRKNLAHYAGNRSSAAGMKPRGIGSIHIGWI